MSMHPFRNLFKEFKGHHRIFCESGSFRGDAIQLAIDAGYEEIYSMDIDPANIEFCRKRFDMTRGIERPPQLKLIARGDTANDFWNLVDYATEPAVFWLDAHSQHFEDEQELGIKFPLLRELDQIKQSAIKTHTIIIDDMLHLTHPEITGWTKNQIEARIMRINLNYKIEYFANPVKDSILVAHI